MLKKVAQSLRFDAGQLDALIKVLDRSGYQVIAPVAEDDGLVLGPVKSADELATGLKDDQSPGTYRFSAQKKPTYFAATHGSQTWKRYLFPPREVMWTVTKNQSGLKISEHADVPKYAFLGVRACDLAAIGVQDDVFAYGDFVSKGYAARRDNALIIAVNCTQPGGTCFCASQGAGPEATTDYDIVLTELHDKSGHWFIASAGSDQGQKILDCIDISTAVPGDVKAAQKAVKKASKNMGRVMSADAPGILARNLESSRWQDIAKRCLDCGNCTFVCPTCFCSTTVDETSLDGGTANRVRQWDSCFTQDYSYIHGGAIRKDGAHRYRQWITHKLLHWHEQFDQSGCVGCGRCITWCPVGIDITEEVSAFAKVERKGRKGGA